MTTETTTYRYRTQRYVAIDEAEALRLAGIDKTPVDKIERTEASPVHVKSSDWVLWSDGRITTAIGLPQNCRPQSLTADAADLISSVRGSDSPAPAFGWGPLTQVDKVVGKRLVEAGGARGAYAAETVQQWTVRMLDGSVVEWWLYTVGYFEGYAFELYASREELEAALLDE